MPLFFHLTDEDPGGPSGLVICMWSPDPLGSEPTLFAITLKSPDSTPGISTYNYIL